MPVLDRLAQILNERQVAYALIGGLGVVVRGEVRATRDIDLLLQVPQLELPGLLDALVVAGFTLDVTAAIQTWNRDHLLDFTCGSVRVDWLEPVLPAFEHVLARARWEQIDGRPIRVADAEGLLLLKFIAFRGRDQEDIKAILVANSGRLDLDWLRSEWLQLVGPNDPQTEQLERLIRDFYSSTPADTAKA
jgi:predicted nucleotidyltransferase